jgi:hypothetical protein
MLVLGIVQEVKQHLVAYGLPRHGVGSAIDATGEQGYHGLPCRRCSLLIVRHRLSKRVYYFRQL